VFETYLRELRAVVGGTADLSTVDTERVNLVLGTAIRTRIETLHPDGLDADDIREVIAGCAGTGADPDVLLIVLAGALGIHPDEADRIERPAEEVVTEHAAILFRHLAGPQRADAHLVAALTDIAVAQEMDLP
jgi:hypothetical protein